MDLKLKGKNAFVSGSTEGIGLATAKALLSEGVHTTINGRSQDKLDQVVKYLSNEFGDGMVKGIVADFSKVEEINKLIEEIIDCDILINNVGIFTSQSFFETPDDDWLRLFDVNVMSGVRLSRKIMPQMLKKNFGRIIFISSECASIVPEDLIAYSMTKTAMLSVSRGLAQLTKGTELTVNAIIPGSTLSEGAKTFLEGVAAKENKEVQQIEKEFFTEVRTSSLLQRFASVDEVANTIVYLCSPIAIATNGAAVRVDGGSVGGII